MRHSLSEKSVCLQCVCVTERRRRWEDRRREEVGFRNLLLRSAPEFLLYFTLYTSKAAAFRDFAEVFNVEHEPREKFSMQTQKNHLSLKDDEIHRWMRTCSSTNICLVTLSSLWCKSSCIHTHSRVHLIYWEESKISCHLTAVPSKNEVSKSRKRYTKVKLVIMGTITYYYHCTRQSQFSWITVSSMSYKLKYSDVNIHTFGCWLFTCLISWLLTIVLWKGKENKKI